MKKKFNLVFRRPEPYLNLEVDVPEDWDEMDYDDQIWWLDDYVNIYELRTVDVEDVDEAVDDAP